MRANNTTKVFVTVLAILTLAGCREMNAEYYVPVGHPADPGSASASPVAIPPLEPTSEEVRPKIPLAEKHLGDRERQLASRKTGGRST